MADDFKILFKTEFNFRSKLNYINILEITTIQQEFVNNSG